MTAPLTAPPGHTCPCGAPATFATRRGPLCAPCTPPATRRLAQANARAAEMWGTT